MPLKRRGAQNNPESSYAATRCKAVNDGWELVEKTPLRTTVNVESTRRIINRNTAPDIPFGQSINPYRGCKHGCIYYYAGLGLSPGLDFESCLFVKPDAANRVRAELSQPGNILRAAKYSDLRPAKVGLKRGFEHPELKPEDDRPETD